MSIRSTVGRGGLRAAGLALLGAVAACANFRHLGSDLDALEGTTVVEGVVRVNDWTQHPVVVVTGQVPDDPAAPINVRHALNDRKPGAYRFRLEPGKYWFAAFEDQNDDGKFQDGERGALTKPIEIRKGKHQTGPLLLVSQPYVRSKDMAAQRKIEPLHFAVGDVKPLSDKHFARELGVKGLWQPVTYATQDRPGIYFTEPYDPARTPVLFVHGMSGYPQEFEPLIKRLDRTRFQAWVFAYPSGYDLRSVALLLHETLTRIEHEKKLARSCLVAHSMGGLVSRMFLALHEVAGNEHSVRGLVTIASPLAGMPSAAWGVSMAPKVVPSWYDISPNSTFLNELYKTPLSDCVEYHLLFAFDDSGNSDSVVPLLSQLRPEAQGEAELVRGYRATHTGALRSDAVAAQVLRALDRCAGQSELGLSAIRKPEPIVVK